MAEDVEEGSAEEEGQQPTTKRLYHQSTNTAREMAPSARLVLA